MKIKNILIYLIMIFIILLSACSDPGGSKFVSTGRDYLYYDLNTKIVYYKDGYRLSAYYCEHGVPYSFNPATGELVCISN